MFARIFMQKSYMTHSLSSRTTNTLNATIASEQVQGAAK